MQDLITRTAANITPNTTSPKASTPPYRLGWNLLTAAIILALQLFSFNPPEHYYFQAEQLGDAISVGDTDGFYRVETDPAGRRFSWTSPAPVLDLELRSFQPVEMNIELRSAAQAGGPDAPVLVLVNGVEAGRLHPNPESPEFQPFHLTI